MSYKGIISKDIQPLTPETTISEALIAMNTLHLEHLPVVENKKLVGVVTAKKLHAFKNKNKTIATIELDTKNIAISIEEHLFNIIQFAANHHLTCIAMLNTKDEYIGAIKSSALIHYIADYFSFTTPGSIIILEMHPNDYSLTEIAGIVENNHAKIIGLFTRFSSTNSKMEVNIKINKEEIEPILQTFNRYNYHIKSVFSQYHVAEELKGRYEALINYLSI